MTIVNSPFPQIREADSLRAHPWFAGIGEAALERLALASTWLRFDAGNIVFSEGQAVTACLLVCEGAVQGVRYTAGGDEKVFGQVGPGGWFSVLTLFQDEPRHLHTARAASAGGGCLVDGQALRDLCRKEPVLAERVLRHGANLIRHHTDQIDWLTSSSAEERLAEYVLRMAQIADTGRPALVLTHTQIAVKLGMRAETLSRILAKWRREGLISCQRGAFRILRPESLRDLLHSV